MKARNFTHFTRSEIKELSRKAKPILKEASLHIKGAPKKLEYARILIVISRKVGNAVVRNKLRRRIRHIFMTNNLQNSTNDTIIYCQPYATQLSYQDLEKIILGAISKKIAQ